MVIRVGIEGGRRPVLAKAKELGAPILISANSLWDDKQKHFSSWRCYTSHDVALDSSGFVAMKLYGGYRWSVTQYIQLAKDLNPTWWAQMDFCCEPEIASNRTRVFQRIEQTAAYLNTCTETARQAGVADPMPVLQGWLPSDYCEGPIYAPDYKWPAMVGIGSVCRRQVKGADGILAVLYALDQKVPEHVKFHLFGVKSTILQQLTESFSHRVTSIDSMAWAFAARCAARKRKVTCDGHFRAAEMEHWYKTQMQGQLQSSY